MNEQKISSPHAIGWTRVRLPDGRVLRGFTANPIHGCKHECRWQMPDGTIAICYAEEIANGLARKVYPDGFAALRFDEKELAAIKRRKDPSGIFFDSMSDVLGKGVPDEWIQKIVETLRECPQHIFQLLTKNAPRLWKFYWPKNVWLGASMPPDFMFGKRLHRNQQQKMLKRTLRELSVMPHDRITWMSFEPLSWDVSELVAANPKALDWAVIGAASKGRVKYQPKRAWVENLLSVLDAQGVPVYMKSNLDWQPRRIGFPNAPALPVTTQPALL